MRFEYKVITMKSRGMGLSTEKADTAFTEQLNQEGLLGWNLVNVMPYGASVRAFLKREK
ncbi:hypothetical protein GCM10009069_11080 [Algimonas arctica]|uniref:DUF4177 domain-containing protein n=1 Tax=Algimonas arctica TaxID=1479486 RepID=A0A8J3G213_9PROT|nr:hypothetical protein GCM10009069_11080 [Algimonas arctica]